MEKLFYYTILFTFFKLQNTNYVVVYALKLIPPLKFTQKTYKHVLLAIELWYCILQKSKICFNMLLIKSEMQLCGRSSTHGIMGHWISF